MKKSKKLQKQRKLKSMSSFVFKCQYCGEVVPKGFAFSKEKIIKCLGCKKVIYRQENN